MYFYKWLGRTYALNRKNLTAKKSDFSETIADLRDFVANAYYAPQRAYAFAA